MITRKTTRIVTGAFAAVLGAMMWAAVGQAAGPVLIAIGTISGFYEDFATQTAAPLENGVRGNRLGGIGSGIAYLGGDFFVALPDRGPNAVAFNPCTDDTVSYINRFHTVHMSLSPSDPGSTSLPFTLTPMVVDTTLLSSQTPLVYGAGCGLVGNGEPALNDVDHTYYFTGRSDNFDPIQLSTEPGDARFDTEGIRVSNNLHRVYISDKYGPYVYEFDRLSGRRVRAYTLPKKFAISNLNSVGDLEISGNTSGRVTNKGMEGLAITPDGRTLVGAMQSPLAQDGGDVKGGVTRIVTIDIPTGKTREYAYQLDTGVKTTISEIVAINNHEFLVDERDSKGLARRLAGRVQAAVPHRPRGRVRRQQPQRRRQSGAPRRAQTSLPRHRRRADRQRHERVRHPRQTRGHRVRPGRHDRRPRQAHALRRQRQRLHRRSS